MDLLGPIRHSAATLKSTVIHSAQTLVKHAPARPLTKENAEFVKKYGFLDLPNDAVRQYRDKMAALEKQCDKYPPEKAARLKNKLHHLFRKAGADPKLRANLNNLYRLVQEQGGNLNAKEMDVALALLSKGTIHMDSPEERNRFAALLRSTRIYGSNQLGHLNHTLATLSSRETNAILKHLAHAKMTGPTGASLWGIAGNMAIYTIQTRKSRTVRANAQRLIAKINGHSPHHVGRSLKHEWHKGLESIAKAEHDEARRKDLIESANQAAIFSKYRIREAVQYRYGKILKHHGFRGPFAESMAEHIYKAGGPGSKTGVTILANMLAARKKGHVNPKEVVALAREMLVKTQGVQPGKLEKINFSHLLAPSGNAHTHFTAFQKLAGGILGNGTTMVGAGASTGAAGAELVGAEGAALGLGTLDLEMAITGSVLTAVYIGAVWKKIRNEEAAYYGARGFWTAIEAGRNYSTMPDIDDEAILGYRRAGVRGTIHEAGAHAFKKTFKTTYERLAKMPEKERHAYCLAMLEIRDEYHLRH